MTYVVTAAARRLSLHEPDPALIDFDDVAARLGEIRRYAGMAAGGWTVAQHTLLVAILAERACPEALPYALLHDAHEGYLGDWITPVKQALAPEGRIALMTLESRMAAAIHSAARVCWPAPMRIAMAVKEADQRAYVTEVEALIPPRLAREFSTDGLPASAGKNVVQLIAGTDAVAVLRLAFARMRAGEYAFAHEVPLS